MNNTADRLRSYHSFTENPVTVIFNNIVLDFIIAWRSRHLNIITNIDVVVTDIITLQDSQWLCF